MKNVIAVAMALTLLAPGAANSKTLTFESCMADAVLSSAPETTVGDLQVKCVNQLSANADTVDTATEERLVAEQAISKNQFALLQHRQNYLLPAAYNFKSDEISASSIPGDATELDPTEFKFQLSFKAPIWNNVFGTRGGLFAAYTNTSWWQAYNKDESSPFRETNHQPELFIDIPTGLRLGDWELANSRLGISHQSNGRSGDFSRTWNRVFAELVFSNEDNEIRLMPWTTISDQSDNPEIEDFRGRFQLSGTHLLGDHTLGWQLRHSLNSSNRGSLELDWSFPIKGRHDMQFFIQYFDGYGESLIDYNSKARRLGAGIKLGSW